MPDLLLAEDFNKVTMAMTFTVPLLRDCRASRVGDVFQKSHGIYRGAGTTVKLEGGGGRQTSPGVQGNPYPKLKTPGFGPLFLGETKVHV